MNQASIDHVAHTLLFANSLEEKMWMPEQITKETSQLSIPIPDQPGRPAMLSFGQGRSRFPSAQELKKPSKRAEALLFFANHELLAIELMSLFILRFPETPWKFRRSFAGSYSNYLFEIQDKQLTVADLVCFSGPGNSLDNAI